MSEASDYLELKVLEHIVGKNVYSIPTAYVALLTAPAVDSDTSVEIAAKEPTYPEYTRATTTGGTWAAAAGGSISNAGEIAFPQALSGSDTITSFCIMDSSSGGNMLCYGDLTVNISVVAGVTPKFEAGNLTISLD